MDVSFRNALVISVAIHAAGIGPTLGLHAPDSVKKEPKDMTVDYVVIKEKSGLSLQDTPKIDIAKNVEIKPEEQVRPAETLKEKEDEKSLEDADALAKKEVLVKSTKDYINYYQLIREKIRRQLKIKYRDYSAEGEAQTTFIINSDGSLVSVAIDRAKSVPDGRLLAIAESSVKDASPFPAFPKAINPPTMSFNLTITFKKR